MFELPEVQGGYYSDIVERHALLGLVGPATVQCSPEDPTANLTRAAVHGARKAHRGRFTWPLHCSRLAGAPPDPIRPPTCCFTRENTNCAAVESEP